MEQAMGVTSHVNTTEHNTFDNLFLSLHDIPENHDIDKRFLNIENKIRSNLLTWKGQFSPQLIEILLEKYAFREFKIFDPFLGSGTLIVEAARHNLSVLGSEINPAAYHLSNIYTFCNYDLDQRKILLNKFEKHFSLHSNEDCVFTKSIKSKESILENFLKYKKSGDKPEFLILVNGLIILLDTYKNGTKNDIILKYWDYLRQLILILPYSTKEICILNSDARNVDISDCEIDLVITSPPYINVFNYHQQYRASAELLGENVLEAARSEIGSNRKHRGNRYLTVIQYIYDMHSTFSELKRLCKSDARVIFIVGRESNVRKTSFFNSEIIASVAKIAGLDILYRQERVFLNRFGQSIYEDIIHFINKKNSIDNIEEKLKKLALEVLINATERAPEESRQDLLEAITSVSKVKESPIYNKEGK